MTFLDEFKKKKKTLKNGVLNMVQRARGYIQDEDDTPNQPSQPARERPPTPDMSDWDASEEEEVPAEERRRRLYLSLKKHLSEDNIQRNRQRANKSVQKHQEAGQRRTNKEVDVERKMSLDLGPTASVMFEKGQTCSSESEHLQIRGTESRDGVGAKGKKHSSKRGHRVCPDVPAWKVQQWCENFGDTSVGIQYKRQLSPIPIRSFEKETVREEMMKASDMSRPKCNYRKSRTPKTSPMKPQHPIHAAGFVARNTEDLPQGSPQQLTERQSSGPKMDDILGLDEEIPSFVETVRSRMSGFGGDETSRIHQRKHDTGYGRNIDSRNRIMEYCTSDEDTVSYLRMHKREASSRLNAVRGESSRSMRTVSPQVGSDGDPLDGLDDLLSEVERIETDREQRRTASRMVPSSQCRSESVQSWSSVNLSKDNSHCAVDERVLEPVDRMRRQRADRRRELEVMDQLLEELY